VIPIVLSVLVPGLGQIYLGKNWRGILMIVLCITPLYPAILVWSIIDVISLNRQGLNPQFTRGEGLLAISILVVVVPAALAGLVYGAARGWSWYQERHSKPEATRAEAVEIVRVLEEFRGGARAYPDELEIVIGQRPLRAGWRADEWGHPYRYTVEEDGQSFELVSAGPDGRLDTEDDLVFRGEMASE
jgi:TM2 domain-containing membrane protein YozV